MNKHEFINRYIHIWGEDEVERLLDNGFEPVLVSDDSGREKWVWLLTQAPSCATVCHAAFTSRLSGSEF